MSLTLKVSTSLWLIFKSTGLQVVIPAKKRDTENTQKKYIIFSRKRRKHAISNTIEESKTWKVDIEHYAEDVEERYRNQHVTHFSNVMNHKLDSPNNMDTSVNAMEIIQWYGKVMEKVRASIITRLPWMEHSKHSLDYLKTLSDKHSRVVQ
eukprot:333396_1